MSMRDAEAMERLRNAIAKGKDWYTAMLETVCLWTSSEENYNGRHYRYVIDNEAFDWLILAERLCDELHELIPEHEQANLLFFGIPPVQLSKEKFKTIIGNAKYQAYLNYFYGVVVERFLILAEAEEIRKEKRVLGLNNDNGVLDEAYLRIYGATQSALLKQFRKEKRYRHRRSMNLTELNEFTYWLFKYRIRARDKSCVASDTKKALTKFRQLLALKGDLTYSSILET